MIKNVKDATALLDRRFGAAIGSPSSVLRTLVWVVVGIYAIGLLVPAPKVVLAHTSHNRPLRGTAVADLILDKNDPRGWQHLKKDPSKFTIAWIGTSPLQTVRPGHHGYVPVDVLKRLPTIDGKPTQVNMYLFDAGRLLDIFAASADSLRTRPDLIMVDLNPLWIFNDRAIQGWPNLNPAALPALVGNPANWPLLAAMDSPYELATSIAGSHLPVIRDRWTYAEKLRTLTDKLSPLTEPTLDPTAKAPKLSGVQLIAAMQSPLNFWDRFRPQAPHGSSNVRQQEGFLLEAKTDGSVLSDNIVTRLLDTLGSSKIPSIVYVSAIRPSSLHHPGVDAALHRVESRLQQIADEHRAPTLLVRSQSATRFVHGLLFKDLVHTTYDLPLVDYLVGMVCAHLKTLNPATECTPTPRIAGR